jgi:hypothetical protein
MTINSLSGHSINALNSLYVTVPPSCAALPLYFSSPTPKGRMSIFAVTPPPERTHGQGLGRKKNGLLRSGMLVALNFGAETSVTIRCTGGSSWQQLNFRFRSPNNGRIGAAGCWDFGYASHPGFDLEPTATRTAVITGILLVFVERMTLYFYRTWEEWISVIIGAWLVISPWVLSISVLTARENFVVVGLLVMALTVYELWQARRQSRNG